MIYDLDRLPPEEPEFKPLKSMVRLAKKHGQHLSKTEYSKLDFFERQSNYQFANLLLDELATFTNIDRMTLQPYLYAYFRRELNWMADVIAFWKAIGVEGVLAAPDFGGVYDAVVPFDVFSSNTVKTFLPQSSKIPDQINPKNWPQLGSFLDEASPILRDNTFDIVDRSEAATGFLSLFLDDFLVKFEFQGKGRQKDVLYTVNSNKNDFHLNSQPLFRNTLQVFGAKLSSPVEGRLNIGRYRFWGQKTGQTPIRDPGIHRVAPGNTATRTRAF